MDPDLVSLAQQVAEHLQPHQHTLGVAESSAGGLISAVLLAIPGASAYFIGGAVVYTRASRSALLQIPESALEDIRPSTEPYALLLAQAAQQTFGTTWAIAETGATGPTGNRYGDPPGHACLAIVGPTTQRTRTLETGSPDRQANMQAFARAALQLLLESLK